jgi:membrane protease YdiL (CAAX protease family)
MAAIVPLTLLQTWIYNHNGRSILGTILLHFMYNFSLGMVYPLSQTDNLYHVILMYVAATIVVVFSGRLIARPESTSHPSMVKPTRKEIHEP